jgi:hypothetical protein
LGRGEARKRFFFEKKNEKLFRFWPLVSISRGAHLLLVGLLAASLIAPACLARGKTPLTYDQVFALQALLRTLAPQQTDKLLIDETIQQSGGICDWGCDPLKIWVVLDGKHIDLPLVDHSRIGRPNDELLGKTLPIDSNSPLTLSVNADIQFKKPDGVAVPAGYFIDALRQVNALIYRFVRHDKGFISALFSPKYVPSACICSLQLAQCACRKEHV